MSWACFWLLVGAGVAAGLTGYLAGLASLFSYPALLAVGLPPTAANVTNTVSLAVGVAPSVAGARPELAGQAGVARRLGVLSALGGAAGAGLLLLTPPGVFARIVPFLVGVAAVLLLGRRSAVAEPVLGGMGRPARWVVDAGVLVVSVYGGYFGAAAGVLMLALLLTATPETLVRATALKTLLLGLANLVAALGFVVFGPVAWRFALPLTGGLLMGSWLAPWVARRLPAGPFRVAIALAGIGLAVKLGIDAY